MRNSIFAVLMLCIFTIGCSRNNQQQQTSQNTTTQLPPAASQQPATAGFQNIPPAEAQQLIDSRKDLMIVDVRSPQELKEGAIANSVLIPFWQILRGQYTLPKDKPLLLVCAVGGRSYAVGQVLQRRGYHELYSLSGGIDAWKKAGLPLKY